MKDDASTHYFNREDLICVRLAVHDMMQLQYILDNLQLYKFYCMAKITLMLFMYSTDHFQCCLFLKSDRLKTLKLKFKYKYEKRQIDIIPLIVSVTKNFR